MSHKATYRFDKSMNEWLKKEAKQKNCSKNDILRYLINKEMMSEAAHRRTG